MKLFLLFFLSFLLFNITQAQTWGCTDIQAINFNPNSTQNDGSCQYRATTITPQLIYKLPTKLNETSGIVCINNRIYTHNDAGNENYIYELNEDKDTIIHATKIVGLDSKTDFEDISADNKYLYICDAGNNKGNRKNLKIIKIALVDLQKDSTVAEKIEFNYPDQKNFTKRDHAHNFDCEAMFCWNDTIHIFTKNWLNYYTKHYILSTKPGVYAAQFIDSFNVEMLV
ncbi:MAG: hypothetical protein HYZ42_07985, partial [Bacteroidetes bacterium]|nr:hypothetical protein [Bacteroidota bacterium]